jgi:tRNA pseudouridine55 synthase
VPSGLLLLDKPRGLSSNAALQRVRHAYGAAKAGHVGSLDPLATGMLPICLDEATKVAGEIVGGRKAYAFTVQLGARTATGDVEGPVVESAPVPALDRALVTVTAGAFLGVQAQTPPMYSALKRHGEPLYALARRGVEVERAPRNIEVHRLDVERVGDAAIDLELECSKGTYVRVLAEDLARSLGTVGHVIRLHRRWVEPFRDATMVTLEAVLSGAERGDLPALLPIESGLQGRAAVRLGENDVTRLRQGQAIAGLAEGDPGAPVVVRDGCGQLVALAEFDAAGTLRARRIFNL